MITNIEFNVLNVMSCKEGTWNWMTLDRTLHSNNIPGFSHVVEIVTNLAKEGLVHIEDSGHPSMPHYRVSKKATNFLKIQIKIESAFCAGDFISPALKNKIFIYILFLSVTFNAKN